MVWWKHKEAWASRVSLDVQRRPPLPAAPCPCVKPASQPRYNFLTWKHPGESGQRHPQESLQETRASAGRSRIPLRALSQEHPPFREPQVAWPESRDQDGTRATCVPWQPPSQQRQHSRRTAGRPGELMGLESWAGNSEDVSQATLPCPGPHSTVTAWGRWAPTGPSGL